MPNSWNLVPAGLWPLQPHSPQADAGQGAGFVPPPSGPAAWPNFALDYASPEAAAVLRSWAEPHALLTVRRQPAADQNTHLATGDPYEQMLADAKASHDLLIGLFGLASAVPRLAAQQAALAQMQPMPPPAMPDEEGQHKPAARLSEAGKAD